MNSLLHLQSMVTTATNKQVAVIQIMDLKTRFQNSPIKLNSCRTDFCTAKFGHLKVELEEAQVRKRCSSDDCADQNGDGACDRNEMPRYFEMKQTNKEIILNTFSVNSLQAQIKQLECQLADHGIR